MERFYHFVLIFCVVFNFRIPVFHNSTLFALALALPALLMGGHGINYLVKLFKSRYISNIIFSTLFLLLLFALLAVLQHTNDYSFSYKFSYILIIIVVSTVLLAIMHERQSEDTDYIRKIVFTAFFVQANIQLLSFINSDFFDFIGIFHDQSSEVGERAIVHFKGLRGGALSGVLFFSLGAYYGFVIFMYVKYIIDNKRLNLINIIFIIFYIIGVFMSARTGYAGILIAFVYFILVFDVKWGIKVKLIMKLFFSIFSILLILYLVVPEIILERVVNVLMPYAFEFVYNYFDTGAAFFTASTNVLIEDMLVYPSGLDAWLFGEGRLMNIDGSYYMRTDAGYSRILFHSGIFGLVLLFFYQILFYPIPNINMKQKKFYKNNYNKTVFLAVLYIMIVNIKGLALGTMGGILVLTIFLYYDTAIILSSYKFQAQKGKCGDAR